MNPVIQSILARRSIRKYAPGAVEKSELRLLLKSAMYAPSARNEQPWHFIVIDSRELLIRLGEAHPYGKMLPEAACAILVCGDTELEKSKDYWPVDCAAATQNILLAAHSLGIGSVWLGVYPRRERQDALREIFELPANIHPFSLVSLGRPAEQKPDPDRFREDRIRWNRFS